jgi:hypothetical protein
MNDLAPGIAVLCDAAEEWAESLDLKADELAIHGQEGRRAAAIYHDDAAKLRETISQFRPLRHRDPDTDEWIEVAL